MSPGCMGPLRQFIPDRIETGTIMAAAATDGEVKLTGTRLDLVASVARILEARASRFRRRRMGWQSAGEAIASKGSIS